MNSDIDKKLIAKVASTLYKDDYQKVAAENEDFETLVETLKSSGDGKIDGFVFENGFVIK